MWTLTLAAFYSAHVHAHAEVTKPVYVDIPILPACADNFEVELSAALASAAEIVPLAPSYLKQFHAELLAVDGSLPQFRGTSSGRIVHLPPAVLTSVSLLPRDRRFRLEIDRQSLCPPQSLQSPVRLAVLICGVSCVITTPFHLIASEVPNGTPESAPQTKPRMVNLVSMDAERAAKAQVLLTCLMAWASAPRPEVPEPVFDPQALLDAPVQFRSGLRAPAYAVSFDHAAESRAPITHAGHKRKADELADGGASSPDSHSTRSRVTAPREGGGRGAAKDDLLYGGIWAGAESAARASGRRASTTSRSREQARVAAPEHSSHDDASLLLAMAAQRLAQTDGDGADHGAASTLHR